MQNVLSKPVELIDQDLDAVAGGQDLELVSAESGPAEASVNFLGGAEAEFGNIAAFAGPQNPV